MNQVLSYFWRNRELSINHWIFEDSSSTICSFYKMNQLAEASNINNVLACHLLKLNMLTNIMQSRNWSFWFKHWKRWDMMIQIQIQLSF